MPWTLLSADSIADAEGEDIGVGILIQGTDGTHRKIPLLDANGHLQVDVLSAAIRALTNSDVVTAELSSTDNAVLDSIATSVGLLDNAVDGNYLNANVNLAGTDAPSGAGTESGVLRTTLPTDGTGQAIAVGKAAVGATVAGNPVFTGGRASATGNPSDVAAGQVIGQRMDLHGCAFVNVHEALPAGNNLIGKVDLDKIAGASVVVGGGTEATALRVTIASDSTGVLSVDDNGGTLTVDGTVTANLSATDNAVLDAIALAVATEGDALGDGVLLQGDDGTDRTNVLVDTDGHLQVDVLSNPSQVVTATHLDVRHLNATDDVVALGAGTAEVGKLAAGTAMIGSVKTQESGRTMKHAKVALSASQTGTTVLDPTAGTKFVLKKLVVSASAGGAVYFYDDTDDSAHAIGPALTLAAGGGWSETWDADDLYRSETADHILKYTSGTVLTGSVYIDYFEE